MTAWPVHGILEVESTPAGNCAKSSHAITARQAKSLANPLLEREVLKSREPGRRLHAADRAKRLPLFAISTVWRKAKFSFVHPVLLHFSGRRPSLRRLWSLLRVLSLANGLLD